MPVKDSHTRINPLPLASAHVRYITVTPERTILSVGEWPLHIYSRYKFVTVSLPKRLRNGRFNSETATWFQVQKWFKMIVGASRKSYTVDIIDFQGGDDRRAWL
jgi:hypothetical protein